MGHEGWKDQGGWGEFPVEEWTGWGGGSLAAKLLGQWSLSHSANLQGRGIMPLDVERDLKLQSLLNHLLRVGGNGCSKAWWPGACLLLYPPWWQVPCSCTEKIACALPLPSLEA
ncbi:hypothetical protein AOLI_G00110220 [Acnodon oligacanthus]